LGRGEFLLMIFLVVHDGEVKSLYHCRLVYSGFVPCCLSPCLVFVCRIAACFAPLVEWSMGG
jgi:hypothetical protein